MQCNNIDDVLELEPVKKWTEKSDWKSYFDLNLCSIHYSGEIFDENVDKNFTELRKSKDTIYFNPVYSNYDINDEITYVNIKVYEIAYQEEDTYLSISVYVDIWADNEVVAITKDFEK